MHPHGHSMHHRAKAGALMKRCGYKSGGAVHEDAAEDRAMIVKAVHEHDRQMHGGKLTKLTGLRHGGHVDGHGAKHHLAKRARGGGVGKGGGKHTKVNVIVAPQGDPMRERMAHQQGMAQGAQAGAQFAAQRLSGAGGGAPPAAAAPGPAGAIGGGAPAGAGMRPGMGMAPGRPFRRGGAVHMESGAGSGPGRIEKDHAYGEGGFKPKMKRIA